MGAESRSKSLKTGAWYQWDNTFFYTDLIHKKEENIFSSPLISYRLTSAFFWSIAVLDSLLATQ